MYGFIPPFSVYELKVIKKRTLNAKHLAALTAKAAAYDGAPRMTLAEEMRTTVAERRKRPRPNSGKPRRSRKKPSSPVGPARRSPRTTGAKPQYTGETIASMADGGLRMKTARWKKGAVGSELYFPANISKGWLEERVTIIERRIAGSDRTWDGEALHVAKNNETPRQIAKKHGVTVASLLKLNETSFDGIVAGSKLKKGTQIVVRRSDEEDDDDEEEEEPVYEYLCRYLDGEREGAEAWESQADIDSARPHRASRGGGRGGGGSRRTAIVPLTSDELEAIGKFDLAGFENWLRTGDDLTKASGDQNVRSVLARVEDLVSGRGVSYRHWDKSFNAGKKVTMQTDLCALFAEAQEWDCDRADGGQGKDLGNGWAIRHPIKKLLLYQSYMNRERRAGRL